MHPRQFVRDSIGMAFSQYVVRLLLMTRGVIAARLLGPAAYGAWNGLMLILDYGVLAPLGTQQGLDQAVPERIVEGDAERLARLKRGGLFNIVLLTSLFALACLLFFYRSSGQIRSFWGLGGVAGVLMCSAATSLAFYHLTLLRSHGNIASVAVWSMIQGSIGALLGLALIPMLGAWGLLVGWLTGTLASLIYVRLQGRIVAPLAPVPSRESLRLLAVGFPMFLFACSNLVMRTLDRIIILRFLGTEALGYYSLGVMAIGLMLYLPDSVAYVLYPRLLRRYRESDRRPESVREPFERTLRAVALLVPVLCGFSYLAADDLVVWVLPRFADGLVPLKVLGFGALGLALANLSSILLMTLGHRLALVSAAFMMAGLGATLAMMAVFRGQGIVGVAWVTMFAYVVDGAILLWLATGALRLGFGARARMLASGFMPLLIAFAFAVFLDRALPWPDAVGGRRALLRLVMGLPLFFAIYWLAVYPWARGLGLRQLMTEFNLPWARRAGAAPSNGPGAAGPQKVGE
ncbi:MAG TPA: oligosaccharide flippase family protein [Candidatus Limnocylindria bacterium]|nr:oligosaccharide flippase family protein [Candidatus Limnocylindria bacterium]